MKIRKRLSARSGRAPLTSPGRPPAAGRDEQKRFWRAIAAGLSSEDAALEAGQVLKVLRQEPVGVSDGMTAAAQAHVTMLIARFRLLNQQIGDAHQLLDRLTAELAGSHEGEPGQVKQHDAEILASLPGVGRIVLATLLAEAWDALQRRDYAALRSLTGVAPVTKRSGKSLIVIRRQACQQRLSNAMYHWTRVAVQHDRISRAKYAALRTRGHSHGRALRSAAYRLLNVACAMLKTGTTLGHQERRCHDGERVAQRVRYVTALLKELGDGRNRRSGGGQPLAEP